MALPKGIKGAAKAPEKCWGKGLADETRGINEKETNKEQTGGWAQDEREGWAE